MAAKALTQTQTIEKLSEVVQLPKKQVKLLLDSLSALAYKEAKNEFIIPGLGKLVVVQRKARSGRNPTTGDVIKIPAKKVVKFKVSKTAKDAILGPAASKPAVPVKKAPAKAAAPAKAPAKAPAPAAKAPAKAPVKAAAPKAPAKAPAKAPVKAPVKKK